MYTARLEVERDGPLRTMITSHYLSRGRPGAQRRGVYGSELPLRGVHRVSRSHRSLCARCSRAQLARAGHVPAAARVSRRTLGLGRTASGRGGAGAARYLVPAVLSWLSSLETELAPVVVRVY